MIPFAFDVFMADLFIFAVWEFKCVLEILDYEYCTNIENAMIMIMIKAMIMVFINNNR